MTDIKSPITTIGIFLGGMRCGSTAINDYLKTHPEICMYKNKDPHFFSGDKQWQAGWETYLKGWANFDPQTHKVAFESSTHYTKLPLYPHTAERMATSPFKMKLIYGVRPPLERIESHLIHNAGKGYFDPNDQLSRIKMLNQAISVSNYEQQILGYETYFSPSQLYIMDTRLLIEEPKQTLKQICKFLEIDDSFEFESIARRPRNFKKDTSSVSLTIAERILVSRALYEPIRSFEQRYGIKLWDGEEVV
jgi:hypothetical protein